MTLKYIKNSEVLKIDVFMNLELITKFCDEYKNKQDAT